MNKFFLLLLSIHIAFTIHAQHPPKRELRGAWITTFYGSDWPDRTETPVEQQAAFINILDHHKATGINVIYVQMRSQCDAMYASNIEPWSADLTGKQGLAPSPLWDPLQFAIDETHKRGIEFHAWLNPYRAVSNAASLPGFAATHIAKVHPEWILKVGNILVLNPGLPAVRDYVTKVIVDILHRYDVDGIHFDDYFYPSGTINDDSTFIADPRGFTNRADWRRDNVNLLVKRIYDSVKTIKPWVKFGISPTGIYRNSTDPNIGSDTHGQEHYTELYADSKKWLQQGWVDYIAPQVYWYIGQPNANYAVLIPWWNNNANGKHIYIGMAGYKVNDPASGTNWANPSQIPNELRMNRNYPNVYGQIIYSTTSLRSKNTLGFRDSLRLSFYQKPALLPTMPWRDSIPPASASALSAVKWKNDSVVLSWTKPFSPINELDKIKKFVIYRSKNAIIDTTDANNILTITNTDINTFTDTTIVADSIYYYTVTALDHFENESAISNIASNTPPRINCPSTQVIYLNGSHKALMPDYTELAIINNHTPSTSPITITQNPKPGTVLNGIGTNIVSLSATDVAGNTSSCNFIVRRIDVTSSKINDLTNNSVSPQNTLTIKASPNPTNNQFIITTESNSKIPLNFIVFDAMGKVVETKIGIVPNGTVYIGASYHSGIYYVQIMQGENKQSITLMKLEK